MKNSPPAVRSLLKTNLALLNSGRWLDRKRGADALGELGENGKPARKELCRSMLDRFRQVAEAAAEALKKIDPNLHEVAVPFIINADNAGILADSLQKAAQLGKDGRPLSPVVLRALRYGLAHLTTHRSTISLSVQALAAIDPDDEAVNRAVLALLRHPDWQVKLAAVKELRHFAKARSGVKALLGMARVGQVEALRTAAIEDLPELADDDNRGEIKKNLEAMKYDRSPGVREAVKQALAALVE